MSQLIALSLVFNQQWVQLTLLFNFYAEGADDIAN